MRTPLGVLSRVQAAESGPLDAAYIAQSFGGASEADVDDVG